jgi:hypothetical protein
MEWMKIHQLLVDFPSSWSAVAAACESRRATLDRDSRV